MRRLYIVIIFLISFNTEKVYSQDYSFEIDSLTNLLVDKTLNGKLVSSVYLDKLTDSCYEVSSKQVMTNFCIEYIKTNNLFIPIDYIKFPITETYKILLAEKYKIDYNYLHSGCIVNPYYKYAYQFMYDTILKKYGMIFFDKTKNEAEILERKGLGLKLPFIENENNTIKTIKKAITPIIDTLKQEYPDQISGVFIFFSNGKVKDASLIDFRGSSVHENIRKSLTIQLKKLKWTPPKYQNKNIDKSIEVNFLGKNYYFR